MSKKGYGQTHIETYTDLRTVVRDIKRKVDKEFISPCIHCEYNNDGFCNRHKKWCRLVKHICISESHRMSKK